MATKIVRGGDGKPPRRGWEEAARQLGAGGEDGLLDTAVPTAFDDARWVWEETKMNRPLPRPPRR